MPALGYNARMELSVQTDIEQAIRKLQSIAEAQQLRFAVAAALTDTAKQGQAEVKANMPRRFTLRRQWVVSGIRIKPATKADLEAWVYSKDPFMGRQEQGGIKRPKEDQHLAVPYQARRNPRSLIRTADLPRNLGKASIDVVNRRGAAKTIKGKGGQAFKFETGGITYLVRRRGKKLEFLYALKRDAKVEPRLGLAQDVTRIAKTRFMRNLEGRLTMAVRTAR